MTKVELRVSIMQRELDCFSQLGKRILPMWEGLYLQGNKIPVDIKLKEMEGD